MIHCSLFAYPNSALPSPPLTLLSSSHHPQVRVWSKGDLRTLEDRLLVLGPGRWDTLREQVSMPGELGYLIRLLKAGRFTYLG